MLPPLKSRLLLQTFQVLKTLVLLVALQVLHPLPRPPPGRQHAFVLSKSAHSQSSKLTLYSPLLLPLLLPLPQVPPQSLLLQVSNPVYYLDHSLANK